MEPTTDRPDRYAGLSPARAAQVEAQYQEVVRLRAARAALAEANDYRGAFAALAKKMKELKPAQIRWKFRDRQRDVEGKTLDYLDRMAAAAGEDNFGALSGGELPCMRTICPDYMTVIFIPMCHDDAGNFWTWAIRELMSGLKLAQTYEYETGRLGVWMAAVRTLERSLLETVYLPRKEDPVDDPESLAMARALLETIPRSYRMYQSKDPRHGRRLGPVLTGERVYEMSDENFEEVAME
mgnify:CR=1 FL=1